MEAARGRSQQLQAQVEELQEELSLQEARSHGDASLLSELESSLDTAGLGVSKEEVPKQQVDSEPFNTVRPPFVKPLMPQQEVDLSETLSVRLE